MCSCSQISSDNKPYTSDKHWKAKKHKVKNRKIGKINCNWPRQVLDKKDNTNKFLYYTVTKGYHYAYPDWECEKGRYSTQVIHLKNKTKNCNHNLYGNKKKAREGKKKQKKCNKLTRVNAKNMKGDSNVKHKRNMITQHQPREKKKKLVLVNHHVPQTPPHVYQINLVILLSRQPHTTEIKKKKTTKYGNAFCQTTQLGWTPYWGKAKKKHTKGGNTSATCCLLQAFRIFFIRLSQCPQLYMDTHHTTPLTLSNTTLKTKQDVHDTFGTAHIETVPLFVFWQVPRHTSRTKRKKKKKTQTATTTYFSMPPFTLCTVFKHCFYENGQWKISPWSHSRQQRAATEAVFFTHTIRTFTKRQHGPIRVAPACVDTAQTDRAHEAVHGLAPGKK